MRYPKGPGGTRERESGCTIKSVTADQSPVTAE